MSQPTDTHVSGSTTFQVQDPAGISGTGKVPAGVLLDANGDILDGRTHVVTVTPTISTSAYATGDAVGGLLTFASAVESAASAATLDSVTIIDKDQELATFDLVLFDQTFTAASDNAVFAPSDADLANCIGVVRVSDYANFSTNSVATRTNVGLGIKLTGTSLFGQLVVRGTPTYTATSDLIVKVAIRGN